MQVVNAFVPSVWIEPLIKNDLSGLSAIEIIQIESWKDRTGIRRIVEKIGDDIYTERMDIIATEYGSLKGLICEVSCIVESY